MDWKPIKTAPRDGTNVLLFVGRGCTVGRFGTYYDPFGLEPRTKGWLLECDVDCERNPVPGDPTHWMPLPDAPA